MRNCLGYRAVWCCVACSYVLVACGGSDPEPPSSGTLGSTGGQSAFGGKGGLATGGSSASQNGGSATGNTNAGGITARGGNAATGGAAAVGGSDARGGSTTGGGAAVGGSEARGGSTAAGGNGNTGGTPVAAATTGGSIGLGTAGATATLGGSAGTSSLRPKNFIKRNGMQFDDGGRRHVFVGTNFWHGMNLAADLPSGDPARLARELDRLQALGITNVRVMAASEGPDTEPYRMTPALMQAPGQYNEALFRGLDALLEGVATRGMRAVMVLNNYWQWSGGMGQYVSWSENSSIPYPVGSTSYQTFETYVAKFYACTACQTNYRNHIQTVVNRRNTISGILYKDDPTIFSWELANEPRRYPSTWIDQIASYIKSLDSNHMVTTGSEGTNGGINFQQSHQSASIDYGTAHIWAENVGKYDPNDSSAANLNGAITYMTNYLTQHESTMRGLTKPLVLEEIGLARDGWTAGGKLDPNATTTNRDKYFKSAFDWVEGSMAQNQSLWGDCFWAWAGEARPSGTWTADPPHEPAGWYSVYDKDASTIAVITAHVANVAAYGR
jgi:mannan endo-1,4-beta-mannosidase